MTYGIILAIQVAFIIHAFKTGRPIYWVLLLFFLPGISCVFYFILEILPEMRRSAKVQQIGADLARVANPGAEVKRAKQALEIADTLQNRQALAQAYASSGSYAEAIELYERCRKMRRDDPQILFELGEARFHVGDFVAAAELLDRLTEVDPHHKTHEREMLQAQLLEATGQRDEALAAYENLVRTFPGEAARCRFALLLQETGDDERARELFEEVVAKARRAPKYYQKAQRDWIQLAKKNLG